MSALPMKDSSNKNISNFKNYSKDEKVFYFASIRPYGRTDFHIVQ